MKKTISFRDRQQGALFGLFIGDALAMPVHWYYNTQALRKDYGEVNRYLKPHNPHPDSILWRSSYNPPNSSADILHEQAQYWGMRGIHYHQFLEAGENTLNVKLVRELLLLLQKDGVYHEDVWLERMISFLTTQGNHKDTYAEEYLRYFFSNYAQGKSPKECGRNDEHHVGGFSLMLPLLIYFADTPERARNIALEHLSLTHGGTLMTRWGGFIASILLHLFKGDSFEMSIQKSGKVNNIAFDYQKLESLNEYPDSIVVGKHFSSACYVDQALPATLYLALKYRESPEKSLIVNTMCGGDNAGRGAILGALLGALHGVECWPAGWRDGLIHPPPLLNNT